MGRARNTQEVEKLEKANAEAEEKVNTGREDVDEFLNGETDKIPKGAEEIAEEEAKVLEEKANAEAEEVEYIIEAPNKVYTGTTATVDFKDGKGVTSNKVILEYFKARGYKITKK